MTLAHVEPEPDREALNLGRLLRSARMARDLSQAELAGVIGVSERSVRSWEHGSPPPADALLALAEALRVRFVADPEHGWRVEEGTAPAAPPVVIVAGTVEAMHAALDRAGVPRAQ
jgi:transcriptional regulator with XRE-family HTH domain